MSTQQFEVVERVRFGQKKNVVYNSRSGQVAVFVLDAHARSACAALNRGDRDPGDYSWSQDQG